MAPVIPAMVTLSDAQFERLVWVLAPKPVPEPMKTPPTVKSAPHIYNVFCFTSRLTDQLTDDVDPKRVNEYQRHEARYYYEWYDSLSDGLKAGLAVNTSNWITELEQRSNWTAGENSIVLRDQDEYDTENNTKHNTQTASTSARPNSLQITMQPPEQCAPGSDTAYTPHDPQHDTQEPSTPPHSYPQQATTQTPEQPAPPTTAERRAPPAPERIKQELDYNRDGLCIISHRKRPIQAIGLDTLIGSLMVSTPHLVQLQLQHQAFGGALFDNLPYPWTTQRVGALDTHPIVYDLVAPSISVEVLLYCKRRKHPDIG